MRDRISYLFSRIFIGRCGFDGLSRFLMASVPLPLLLSMLLRKAAGGYISMFLFAVAMVLFVWSVWRAFSSQLYNRKCENDHFISSSMYRSVSDTVTRLSQIREYRFFRCRTCRTWLRVPRGKGKIRIDCPKCGTSFIAKS
ncbi:MAG: hypothetical protein IKX09_04875 [Oscillospiraceae bacterium]|nr:hypothetical protein [Oscillospiraceae bacterium]MBP1556217.1 hypothetical protein [Oscillospiraceae bacterium]MBR5065565.1 hypothetical protein [Oscillospiraceae bacterium]